MTERTAILLVYAAMVVAVTVALIVLKALHAPNEGIALVCLLILCVAADTGSRVGLHYANKSSSERRDR
jgi:hypothetical protein